MISYIANAARVAALQLTPKLCGTGRNEAVGALDSQCSLSVHITMLRGIKCVRGSTTFICD